MSGKEMNNKNKIESKANLLSGKDLHKNNSVPPHSAQLENVFKKNGGIR